MLLRPPNSDSFCAEMDFIEGPFMRLEKPAAGKRVPMFGGRFDLR
jgi:hypothetical protein